ncbi:hypothetical protein [Rhodococcus pyridinivorans]|uniref:hypothetical protein n=1 Tax=Rhodococcus pyridinivorans TaxID=103816 RepID=UPI0022B4C497|nr:hypothetical protein [Rhodococcus pyridinivorans]MCZ4627503.1 hypothetical protein [Rhodococcus pyridinivorans]MDV7254759.1 hypothetical protein [Rhodococcus pyridinivorans]
MVGHSVRGCHLRPCVILCGANTDPADLVTGRPVRETTVSTLLGDAVLKVRGTPGHRVVSIASDLAGENGFEIDGDSVLLDLPPDRGPTSSARSSPTAWMCCRSDRPNASSRTCSSK